VELPLPFVIRESTHRIHNPFSEEQLATLGRALRLAPGSTMLDLACGSGEMLCTWARDHAVTGTGVDISSPFLAAARRRAAELGVADRTHFLHADAATHVADHPVDIAACIGATWIGGGIPGTLHHLRRSLKPGGLLLIGEPYWRRQPPDDETVKGCHAQTESDFLSLPDLLEHFRTQGCDPVEMVLADQAGWDRYAAAQWLNTRRWLDANPEHELWNTMRADLDTAPTNHVRYQREYLGWGVFALMDR
jgi:SAM-dependent methyltransferase